MTHDDDPLIITDPQTDRYASLSLISWWQKEKVKNAKVMVVGAGALGNEVLKNLALMGVGYILIVDFDTIEHANLSRSVLFRSGDNGRLKAEVAAERVKELNPDVRVKYINGDVARDVGLGVFRHMDVIVGCLDNREARLFINRACWKVNKPWVDGAIEEMNGLARVFLPPSSACYECTLTEQDYRAINVRYSCPLLARQDILEGKVPTTPTISSIIGGIQTQETLKIIHGIEIKGGSAWIFNGHTNEAYVTSYRRVNECPSHHTYDPIVKISSTSRNLKLDDLLSIAKGRLGDDAFLNFDYDLVFALRCRRCQTITEVYTALRVLTESELMCNLCGELRDIEMTCTVDGQHSGLLNMTLSEVGVPPLHIIEARNNDCSCYFELDGDAGRLWEAGETLVWH